MWEQHQATPPNKQELSRALPPPLSPWRKQRSGGMENTGAVTLLTMEAICSVKWYHTLHPKEFGTLQNGAFTKKGRTATTKVICQSTTVATLKLAASQHLSANEGMNSQGKEIPLSSPNAQLAAFWHQNGLFFSVQK